MTQPGDPTIPGAEPMYGDRFAPGAMIGDYRVEVMTSLGGFACIYRAVDTRTDKVVAVKVLHKRLVDTPVILERFRREAALAAELHHPSIVEIYEIGALRDGRPFIAMEWLDGHDLSIELATRGPFTLGEAVSLVEDLGAALAFAHGRGIVHRDVKLQNVQVMPTEGGGRKVKLLDFGIAKLTEPIGPHGGSLTGSGEVLGTPMSMSPEQIRGRDVDLRADIYALGLVLYRVLTNRPAFNAPSPSELYDMHLHAQAPRVSDLVSVPRGVDEVVARCLEKDRDQRFATVEEMVAALRAGVRGEPSGKTATGIAVHVAVLVDPQCSDDRVEAAFDDADAVMAWARTAVQVAGMEIVVQGGGEMLAVAPLPAERDARAMLWRQAKALHAQLATREDACAEVKVTTAVHVAEMETREVAGRVEIVGGPLLELGEWKAIATEVDGEADLTITPAGAAALEET